jgi:putative ABC transport system permease protein
MKFAEANNLSRKSGTAPRSRGVFMVNEFLTRLRFLLSRVRSGDLDAELQFHIEQSIQAKIADGIKPEEARRTTLIEFGGFERTREQCHEQRPGWWMATVLQDLRYALRGFRRNPLFTATLIATLGLGIGVTAAVFSVVDPILFRSLPYAHADRLVSVGLVAPIIQQEFMLGGSYYDWRDRQTPFSSLTSETGASSCDLTQEQPLRLSCASVESTFLPTLGISPVLGRNFTAAEDRPNAPRVALISYGLWKRRFGRSSGILDKTITIDGHETRVIGILPADFEMPTLEAADVVIPQALDETRERKVGSGSVLYSFARLKPGMSIEQAKSALQPLFNYSLSLAPAAFRNEVHLRVRSLRDRQMHDVRLMAWVLLGAVLAVLLISCANVAGLLVVRGASRERELAVRSALGASRARLTRQFLTEAFVLSAAGAALGCAVAEVLLRFFLAMAPQDLPFLRTVHLDVRIIVVTILVSFLCGIFFGVVSAWQRPRSQALAGRSTMAVAKTTLRQWLVVSQLSISTVLLAAAMLLSRSFLNLQSQSLGIQTQSLLTTSITLGQKNYPSAERQMAFFQQVEARLRRLPGARVVALSDTLPPGGNHQDHIYAAMAVLGKPLPSGPTGGRVTWRWVSPEYFRALNIPIVKGQGFSEEELSSSSRFVVLSKLLADRLFPGEDPIGQQIQMPKITGPFFTVVGVAQNVKNGGLAGEDEPEYYRLRRNRAEDWDGTSAIVLKTSLPPQIMSQWMREQISAVDATTPFTIETMGQRVGELAQGPRFVTALVLFFAACGLLLAVIGLYGIISFAAAQRTQEIGVRMALGASRLDILRLITWEGARLTVLGGLIGVCVAFGISQLLKSLLFNVGPHDPFSFLAVAVLLAFVALAASLLPGRTAMKVDPAVALRSE